MGQQYSAFIPETLYSSGGGRSLPFVHGLQPILAVGQLASAPAHPAQLTPDHLLIATTEFIDTTTRLSAKQLHWLAFMKRWLEPQQYSGLESQVEATISENVKTLSSAVIELARLGRPLKIGLPLTGQSVPVIGVGYSTEQLGYQMGIPGSTKDSSTLVPLLAVRQLHL